MLVFVTVPVVSSRTKELFGMQVFLLGPLSAGFLGAPYCPQTVAYLQNHSCNSMTIALVLDDGNQIIVLI